MYKASFVIAYLFDKNLTFDFWMEELIVCLHICIFKIFHVYYYIYSQNETVLFVQKLLNPFLGI